MAEVNHGGSNTPIINYGVSSKEGKIYRSSKTEEAGFQKVELQSGGSVYHKYCDGLEGKLAYIARQEKEIVGSDGKKKKLDSLKMFINDGVNTQALALTTYSNEWKLAIKHLYNVDFSKNITISFYKKKAEEGEKQYLNCAVKYTGEKTADDKPVYPEWLDTMSTEKGGQVPPPVKNKKGEWEWTDNDLWYLDRASELIKRYMEYKDKAPNTADGTAPKQEQAPVKQEETKGSVPTATAQEAFEPAENQSSAPEPKNDLPF